MKLNSRAIIFVLALISCDNKIVFDDYHNFENQTWSEGIGVSFTYPVRDTTSKNKVVIKVRHTTDYEFQNLFLFIKTEKTDTVELIISNKEGKWLGRGVGDIRELEFVYSKDKVFTEKGDFTFEIEQAMRYGKLEKIKHLKNISEVGLSIQNQDD